MATFELRSDRSVRTRSGIVRGLETPAKTLGWLGIPYAAPPVGPLRWKAPRDPEPWSEPLEATRYGPLACQVAPDRGAGTSEDCLYLNVWRPRTDETGLPVYFWIHGSHRLRGVTTRARSR